MEKYNRSGIPDEYGERTEGVTLKLTYYGTAAGEGWPGLFCNCELCNQARNLGGKNIRTRSQALVNDDLLIDLPPDTNMHSLVYGLDLSKVNHLLVTHSHSDHFSPTDLEMVREPYAHERPNVFHVYGNEKVKEKLWSNVPGISEESANLEIHTLKPFVPIKIKDYTVIPLLAAHDRKEECLFYLIKQYDKSILYAHDTGAFPDQTIEYLKSCGVRPNLVSLD